MYNNLIKKKRPKIKAQQSFSPSNYFQITNSTPNKTSFQPKPSKNNQQFEIRRQIQKNNNESNLGKKIHEQRLQFNQSDRNQKIFIQAKLRNFKKKSLYNISDSHNFETISSNKRLRIYQNFDQKIYKKIDNAKLKKSTNSKTILPVNRYTKSSLSNKFSTNKNIKNRSSVQRYSKNDSETQHILGLLHQAKLFYKASQNEKAIQKFEEILKQKKIQQAQYFLAVSYMNQLSFQKSLKLFKELISNNNTLFKKNIFLLAAICSKKLNQIEQAIKFLSKGIQIYPKYYDCIIYRAKLLLKQKKWKQSLIDFDCCIKINPSKIYPFIGKAQALKNIGKINQAIELLSIVLSKEQNMIALSKRMIYYYQMNKIEQAYIDVENYLKMYPGSSEIYYYSGIIYSKMQKNSEALLNFEQVLKTQENEYYMTKTIQQILKIKIKQKNLYDALQTLNQSQNLKLDRQYLDDWILFIEASLLLMKKKYQQGIEILDKLLINKNYEQKFEQNTTIQKQRYEILKPLIHLYKGYANLILNQIQQTKKDYQIYDQFQFSSKKFQQNLSKKYNTLIIKSIQGFPELSEIFLIQANKLYPSKSQPYFFLALTYTQNYLSNQNLSLIQKIKFNLDKAIQYLPQLSNNHVANIYYHRSVINLYINQYTNSLLDIDKAIQKSEDNIAKYYYVRGFIFQVYGNYEQAIKDLSISIKLNPKFEKVYLQRAKCLQNAGKTSEAFLDLQTYINLIPQDPEIHKYAGIFLFQNSVYEDSLNAFNNFPKSTKDIQVLQMKGKCQVLLGDYKSAIQSFYKYNIEAEDLTFMFDINILNSILNILESNKVERLQEQIQFFNKIISSEAQYGKIFKKMDIFMIRGGLKACAGDYKSAIQDFQRALKLREQDQKIKSNISKRLSNFSKQVLQSSNKIIEGWTIFEINYCISLCFLGLQLYQQAERIFQNIYIQYQHLLDKNWIAYKQILFRFKNNNIQKNRLFQLLQQIEIDPQEQIFSKFLPPLQIKFKLTNQNQIKFYLNLLFNYPFIESLEILPEFDHNLLIDFTFNNIQYKPEAPWINRNENGVVFTSHMQVFQNLQISKSQQQNKIESQVIQKFDDDENVYQDQFNNQDEVEQHIINKLKLDLNTQKKLERLFGKKQFSDD